jgi:cytochrome c peroxidase
MNFARFLGLAALIVVLSSPPALATDPLLGLPPVPVPADNPQTPEKIALGDRLFHDTRFSSTGEVSCATCHVREKAFTDSPLKVAEGVKSLKGTRNSPTVINSAYLDSMFWDGREPDLEGQAAQPFVNPVEMALPDHEPILEIVRTDPGYVEAFQNVFGKSGADVTMKEVTQAIAAFERTIVSGNSPFDRWHYGGDKDAMTAQQIRGFDIFINQGRCVSCHVVEHDQATFTDSRFHNIGVGINDIEDDVPELAPAFLKAKKEGINVDVAVLSDKRTSELGRFAVETEVDGVGAFRTPTLRNVAVTAPYMHDGSLATLRDVVVHYNNGGFTEPQTEPNAFLSGGIRPLDLTEEQIDDLVAFMEALTSPEFAKADTAETSEEK